MKKKMREREGLFMEASSEEIMDQNDKEMIPII
jgi:hypothetical protein